jgi:hypothetical protein
MIRNREGLRCHVMLPAVVRLMIARKAAGALALAPPGKAAGAASLARWLLIRPMTKPPPGRGLSRKGRLRLWPLSLAQAKKLTPTPALLASSEDVAALLLML